MADTRTSIRKPRGQSRKGVSGRLWERVSPEPNSGCWLWLGGHSPRGYGMFYVNGKNRAVHRVSFELYVGPIPDGLELDHKCRNPACLNPAHLEPVTHIENMRRGQPGIITGAKQRAKTHCPSGHKYEGRNLYVRNNGERECAECSRIRSKEYQRKRRARRSTNEQ